MAKTVQHGQEAAYYIYIAHKNDFIIIAVAQKGVSEFKYGILNLYLIYKSVDKQRTTRGLPGKG